MGVPDSFLYQRTRYTLSLLVDEMSQGSCTAPPSTLRTTENIYPCYTKTSLKGNLSIFTPAIQKLYLNKVLPYLPLLYKNFTQTQFYLVYPFYTKTLLKHNLSIFTPAIQKLYQNTVLPYLPLLYKNFT